MAENEKYADRDLAFFCARSCIEETQAKFREDYQEDFLFYMVSRSKDEERRWKHKVEECTRALVAAKQELAIAELTVAEAERASAEYDKAKKGKQ